MPGSKRKARRLERSRSNTGLRSSMAISTWPAAAHDFVIGLDDLGARFFRRFLSDLEAAEQGNADLAVGADHMLACQIEPLIERPGVGGQPSASAPLSRSNCSKKLTRTLSPIMSSSPRRLWRLPRRRFRSWS